MPPIAQLVASVEADVDDFNKGLTLARDELGRFAKTTTTAADGAAASLKKTDAAADALGARMAKVSLSGASFAVGMKALDLVGDALGFAGDAAIGLNSKLEQAKIGFTGMLGSAQAADAYLRQLQRLANDTPFEFPELVGAAQRFVGMGMAAKDTIPMMQAVADSIAFFGKGKEEIDQVSRAIMQVSAKGKVSAEEMNQLAEAGLPGWRMLADTLGITTGEAMKLAEQGKISSTQFLKSFQEFAANNYGGAAKAQSATFQGAMSTIVDSAGMAIAKGAKPLFDRISAGAITIGEFVKSAAFEAWAVRMSTALSATLADIDKLIAGVQSMTKSVQESVAESGAKAGIEGAFSWLNDVENVVRRGLGFEELPTDVERATKAAAAATAALATNAEKDAKTVADANTKAAAVVVDAWAAFAGKDLLGEALKFKGDQFKDPSDAIKEAAKNLEDAQKAMGDAVRRIGEVSEKETRQVGEAMVAASAAVGKAYEKQQDAVAAAITTAAEKTAAAESDAADKHVAAIEDSERRVDAARDTAAGAMLDATIARADAIDKALDAFNTASAAASAAHAQKRIDLEGAAAEKVAAAIADNQDRVAGAYTKASDALAKVAADTAKAIGDAYQTAAEKTADAIATFNEKAAAIGQAAADKHAAIDADRADRIVAAEEKYASSVATAVADTADKIIAVQQTAADSIASAIADLALGRANRARTDANDATLDAAARARRVLRDAAEAQYQYELDLSRATSEDERARITERFQRATEDSAHRRQLAEEDRVFEAQQEAQRRALQDTLADEALAREVERIGAQRDARVTALTAELADRQTALAAALATEIADANATAEAKHAAVEVQVTKDRATLYAWLAERQAAIAANLADEVAAAEAKRVERETAINAGLARELADLATALGKRQTAIAAQLAKELADNDANLAAKNRANAQKRDADLADALDAYQQHQIDIQTALNDEVAAQGRALATKSTAIDTHLAAETTAIGLELGKRTTAANTAYAADVENIRLALADKLAKVAQEADDERAKLVESYHQRVADMSDEFLAKIPAGSAIKADNFIDALYGKLDRVRVAAVEAGTAIAKIPTQPPNAGGLQSPDATERAKPKPPIVIGKASPQPGETVVGGPDPASGRYAYQRREGNGYMIEWRDQGGPGVAGRPYAIGVPELYVPDRPGQFVPLGGAGAGGGSTTIPVYIGGELITTVVAKANQRWANRGGR